MLKFELKIIIYKSHLDKHPHGEPNEKLSNCLGKNKLLMINLMIRWFLATSSTQENCINLWLIVFYPVFIGF